MSSGPSRPSCNGRAKRDWRACLYFEGPGEWREGEGEREAIPCPASTALILNLCYMGLQIRRRPPYPPLTGMHTCRLKMGVCEGLPGSIRPDYLGRADYNGASVNQVSVFAPTQQPFAGFQMQICVRSTGFQWNSPRLMAVPPFLRLPG